MKKAAVFIDKWKLEIFKKHLDDAGYSYNVGYGMTEETLNIMVEFEWVVELKPIIEAAQKECENKGKPK
jgi:hypothetical protein